MKSLRLATFNVWHGLAGRGPYHGLLGFREFESAAERDVRWRKVLRDCAEVDADIFVFQELNPVSERGNELKLALGGEFHGCVDQSGLKLFSRGVPYNLASGLGTLLRGTIRPARTRADVVRVPLKRKLSGGFGRSGEFLSFHLSEQRYAQFSSVYHEALGRLLIVNTHLHHGFEKFPGLMSLLDQAVLLGKVSQSDVHRLYAFLDEARDRRLSEMDRILEVVNDVGSNHDGIAVCGDFNSVPTSAAAKLLQVHGFRDLYSVANSREKDPRLAKGADGATWDPILNPRNHLIQQEGGFQFPLPDFGNPELTNVYREFDKLPRRIDFLFARGSFLDTSRLRLKTVKTFGAPDESGVAASDHFGVVASWTE